MTIKDYLNQTESFHIPSYQRGYKWGVEDSEQNTAAQILVKDFIKAYLDNKDADYFIQGITGYKANGKIVLIDGQQRTTTLFLLIALLSNRAHCGCSELFFQGNLKLRYDIRKSSQFALEYYCLNGSFPEKDEQNNSIDTQDLFYFKKAEYSMSKELSGVDEKGLLEYIFKHVKLFLIIVEKDEASNVFTMMNGNKAFMTADELIKSDFLCKSSRDTSLDIKSINNMTPEAVLNAINAEWEINSYRSRLAREWDKWIFWWNREDVRLFFRCNTNPLGLLLDYFVELYSSPNNKFKYNNDKESVATVFQSFQRRFISQNNSSDDNDIKMNFEKIRKLQKRFEDIFSDYETYNLLGFLIQVQSGDSRRNSIKYFLRQREMDKLRDYVKWMLVGVTDKEYSSEDDLTKKERARLFLEKLSADDIYNHPDQSYKDAAYQYLFYCNVLASNARGEKFEFFFHDGKDGNKIKSMWNFRSLEHIWPKSKEDLIDNNGSASSVHSIGNLVFLHKHDNSALNALFPEEKKKIIFDLDEIFYSRSLLHTISTFGRNRLDKDSAASIIAKNRISIQSIIAQEYGI